MSRKKRGGQSAARQTVPAGTGTQARSLSSRGWRAVLLLGAAFFLLVLLVVPTLIKFTACLLVMATVVCIFLRRRMLAARMSLPYTAVFPWVLVCGVSTLYASSGKFALYEYLKLLAAFCVFVLVLCFERRGTDAGRGMAVILECAAALSALFSIDLLSTRFLSTPLLGLLLRLSPDYALVGEGLEAGVRMTSIFVHPNVFAGIVGLGVLLSLGLANSTPAERSKERCLHLCCLFINALAFILAFSLGASGTILAAFVAMLALETQSQRMPLAVLMVETLVLSLAAAFPIFLTSFSVWSGMQPVPLLCAVLGAALLCVADRFVGARVGALLCRHEKAAGLAMLGLVLGLSAFAALALNLTGSAKLEAGETLRRSAYPAPGDYVLALEGEGALGVTIESQNRTDAMRHTSTVLYTGTGAGAAYTVPEDSFVVYFNFHAPTGGRLDAAAYTGAEEGRIKLGYKLLPGFIANRMQGLWANQNAIQRTVFFEDGLQLFRRNPVFGLGMGAYESAVSSVQTFRYETKYAHNHYIQMLVETGVVGLAAFAAVLVLSALALWRCRKRGDHTPLLAALGAALVFMAGHAATEFVFSNCYYLLFALGIFALICVCCGEVLPLPVKGRIAGYCPFVIAGWLVIYLCLLGGNLYANQLARRPGVGYADLQTAIVYDRFEWADYMLSYVYSARGESDPVISAQADQYARRLEKVDSNTIPLFLSEYYFVQGDQAQGIAMLHQYVDFTASDPVSWQNAFTMLQQYATQDAAFRDAVGTLYQKLLERNSRSLDEIVLSEELQEFVLSVLA